MKLNWKKIEEQLYLVVESELQRIAKKYHSECFYGFAFDCNTDYGEILLSLNTPVGLKESVQRAMDPADPQKKVWAEIHANLDEHLRKIMAAKGKQLPPKPNPAPKTEADYERDYRWALGDWKFMDIQSRAFESVWKPFAGAIEIAAVEDSAAVGEKLMEMACRVMVRLEKAGRLASLPHTADFKTLVCNHDESLENAELRLDRIRTDLAKQR